MKEKVREYEVFSMYYKSILKLLPPGGKESRE